MSLEAHIKAMDWEKTNQDPECFYRMSHGGIWYPDTIHKPFLRGAVDELAALERRYRQLRSFFDPAEKAPSRGE